MVVLLLVYPSEEIFMAAMESDRVLTMEDHQGAKRSAASTFGIFLTCV